MHETEPGPSTADELDKFLDNLTYLDGEVPPDRIPPPPGPDNPVMVVTSLRLPLELHERLKAAAGLRGKPFSTLVREWIEQGLAGMEDDQPISRAEALRALAGLRPHTGLA
jgi:predicted DNA-binding protein